MRVCKKRILCELLFVVVFFFFFFQRRKERTFAIIIFIIYIQRDDTYLVDEEQNVQQHLSRFLSLLVNVLSDIYDLEEGIKEGLCWG